ncbi:MAG: HNH endonuclease [Thermoleophilia bacterium]|nr:HNH endonuclease [Thermoleophilia bacterium]
MDARTRDFVRRRADERCEYCLLRQEQTGLTHHVEHIIARQHGGADDVENLALACNRCNACKGPNLSGIDPESATLVPLFHPRRDAWPDHFEFQQARIVGKTPRGRATVAVLQMNDERRLERRAELLALGELP